MFIKPYYYLYIVYTPEQVEDLYLAPRACNRTNPYRYGFRYNVFR